jgi:hypothetical protein
MSTAARRPIRLFVAVAAEAVDGDLEDLLLFTGFSVE